MAAVVYAWRRASRTASAPRRPTDTTNLFFMIPERVVAMVALFVVVSVVAIALVLSRPAPEPAAT
ncbi:hypothetical protein [Streptomyces mirabilis]|uniref:hypothetical protein n=1 Tax=Streptomyces mirabilis TaxID=68239 RepID=UPI00368814B7